MAQFTKQLRWTTNIDASASGQPPALVFQDNLYLGIGSRVIVYDRFTGARLTDISSAASAGALPTIDPGLLGTFGGKLILADSSDNTVLYVVVDESTSQIQRFLGLQGRLLWLQAGGQGNAVGPRPYDPPALYGATSDIIFQIAESQRRYQIVQQTGPGSISTPVYSNGTLYGLSNQVGAYAYSFDAFRSIWTYQPAASNNLGPVCEGDTLYVGSGTGKSVSALNVFNGTLIWSRSPLPAPPVFLAAGLAEVFAACANQMVYVLSGSDGKTLDEIPINRRINNPPVVHPGDNIVYIPGSDRIFAYDQRTGNTVDREVAASPYIISTSGPEVIAGDSKTVSTLNLSEVLQQFSIESQLLQDFEVDGTPIGKGTGLAKKPYYSTEVFLRGPGQKTGKAVGGIPSKQVSIKTNSADEITLTINGISYSVSKDKTAQPYADGNGHLRIETPATGISTPRLELSAPFLDEGVNIVIHPDQNVHHELGLVDGDALANARDYEGRPILNAKYQSDQDARNKAAQAISGIMGMAVEARTGSVPRKPSRPLGARKRGIGMEQVLRADSKVNVGVSVFHRDAPPSRPLRLSQSLHLNLDPASGSSIVLNPGITARDVDTFLQQNQSLTSQRSAFGDFVDAIEKGGAKVKEAFVHVADEAINQIKAVGKILVDGVVHVFEIVLDTVEKVVALVQGILQEIVDDIKKALEWLSFLFDWERIVEVQAALVNQMASTVDRVVAAGGLLDNFKSTVDGRLGTLKSDFNQGLQGLKSRLGSISAQGIHDTHGSDSGAASSSVQASAKHNWLQDKFLSSTNASISDPPEGAAKRSVGIDLDIPALEIPADLSGRISEVWTNLQESLTEDVKSTVKAIADDFKTNAGSSPSDILTTSLEVMLDLLEGIGDIAIDVLTAIFDALIALLRGLIEALWNAARAEIKVPFLSELFTWATGEKLTTLNLFALIAAVPVVLIEKLLGTELFEGQTSTRALTAAGAAAAAGLEIAAGSFQGFFGVVTGVANAIAVGIQYGKQSQYQSIGTDEQESLLRKIRVWINCIGGTVTRIALITAALVGAATVGKGAGSFGLWSIPTLMLIVDTIWIAKFDTFADLKGGSAVIAAVMAFILIALFSILAASGAIEVQDWALDTFYAMVTVALLSRILFLISAGIQADPDPEAQAAAFALAEAAVLIGSGLVVLSGGVQIIDGAIKAHNA